MIMSTWYLARVRTPKWDPDAFRGLLVEILQRTGMTDAELGELAGRSRSQANRWKRAENQPDYEPLRQLALILTDRRPDLAPLMRDLLSAAGYETSISSGASEATEDALTDHPEPGRRFEAIDGGKRDPRDYSETDFYNDIVAEPMRVPSFPPLGWGRGTERREKLVWAADLTVEDDLPDHWEWVTKWIAVQEIRRLFAREQAERAARKAREVEQDRRRSNGA